jgi:hypothetical protein
MAKKKFNIARYKDFMANLLNRPIPGKDAKVVSLIFCIHAMLPRF